LQFFKEESKIKLMARIIGIVNAKGGVGKTTTANNLGAYLAAKGKYVLLVDLDPQANATAGLGIRLADDHLNLYHSLINDTEPEAIIRKSSLFGFDILPAAESLAGATVELVDLTDREFRLKRVLDKIRTNYDYILIDNPPSLGLLTVNGLVAAEQVLIPVQCEYYALEGLSQLIKTIDLIRNSLNPQLKILGVLLTMYDKRNKLSQEVVKEVRKNFPGRVFETIIPRAISLAEAPSFGKTILQFDKDSKAADAYNQLAEEILKLS
jgi:chromosome partitioning protein